MIIIHRVLPDLPISSAWTQIIVVGVGRIVADCRRANENDAPLVTLFGHLANLAFVWRGQITPLQQGAQPPPPPGPPPPSPAQQVPVRAAGVVEPEVDPEEKEDVPLRRVRRRQAFVAHLVRQALPMRQGIVKDVYAAQQELGPAIDAQGVEEVAMQVLRLRSAAAMA